MRFVLLLSAIGLHPWAPVERTDLHDWVMAGAGSAAFSGRQQGQLLIPQYRGSSYAELRRCDALLSVVSVNLTAEPFEDELSARTTSLFKGIRYALRRTIRFLGWSANRWAGWMLRAFGFFGLTVLAALVNRDLLARWREKGWHGLRDSVLLGAAVYLRLLLDRHAPLFGKLAIGFALAYGVASHDFVPDASFPLGALDDALAVVLASRGFMLLCPESLVETHAILAARARERGRGWQRVRVPPPTG